MAESDLIRGNVDTVILKVLYEGDRYGYDMIRQINARSGGQWELKQPTLYACLKRLEKQGFVASYWDASESNGGRRKYYSLTDRGREVFVSYKNEWERSRDLFGELITGDEPIMAGDDFSDVEDDEYEVPKRKPRPSQRKKADVPPGASVEYVPPAYDESEYVHASPAEEEKAEPVKETAAEPVKEEAAEPVKEQYVQQSLFDYAESVKEQTVAEETVEQTTETVSYSESNTYEEPVAQPTADPRSIIDEIYASTYTGTHSYAEAREKALYEEKREEPPVKAAPPAPAPKTEPAPVTPPAPPAPAEQKTALQPYAETLPEAREEESLARRQYKDILGELVASCEPDAKAEQAAISDKPELRKFDGVRQAVSELGNEVTVRAHNNSAKEYTHKYYYYSNRLMMTHYTVMCATMFVLGLILFLTFYVGLGMRMRYDYLLYIFMGLLPIIMFITAVILFAYAPDKTRPISVNFRFSIIIRCVIMLQAFVVIYCLNIAWHMPISFDSYYAPSLIMPAVYSLFIPLSEVIFMVLLKSEHYAAE